MRMLLVLRVEQKYEAEVSPPHGRGEYWRTDHPVSAEALIESLRELGCHQTDIGDAFYEADPEWVLRLSQ
jgi:hypothetical protein